MTHDHAHDQAHEHGEDDGFQKVAGQGHQARKKTLVLFLDNLHPAYLESRDLPVLDELAGPRGASRVETILGYSNAIRNTIFTGANPRTHGKWSKFKYDPERSPFKSLGAYKAIDLIPGSFPQRCARFACSRTILKAQGRKKGYGQLSFENVPMDLLPNFDFTEEDITKEKGNAPTIFEMFREQRVPFAYLSLPLRLTETHLRQIEKSLSENDVVVIYLYNLDAAGHWWGVESDRFRGPKRYVNEFLAKVRARASAAWGSDHQVFVFSDHGMSTVTSHVNLGKLLKRTSPGFQKDYLAFIDSTMARFWYRNEAGRDEAHRAMAQVRAGRWLTKDDERRFGVDFPSAEYGQEIFLLEPDTVFFPAYVSWLKPTGMHGFSCDHPSQDGTFIWWDGDARETPGRIHMTDIAPTMLASLGLELPKTIDGRALK
ncbi:MAG: hypothetical protein QOE90_3474 [Thermoplasmata archaeon]|jgi:predicted AlkP superfamily pyrophosphatase or phosphodiesterase|nr:hypothetical protein [Thermoplasmata archaeon]